RRSSSSLRGTRPRGSATPPGRRTTRSKPASPPRVQPSRKKKRAAQPLVTVAKAKKKEDALAGLERWKARHPAAAAHLTVEDVLVDAMRGRSSMWTRIRVNLRHVPEDERPRRRIPTPTTIP